MTKGGGIVNENDWDVINKKIEDAVRRFQKKPHVCDCEFCGSLETAVLGETPEEFRKRTGQPPPAPEKFDPCKCGTCVECIAIRQHDSEKCECDKLICDYCVKLGGSPVKPICHLPPDKDCIVCRHDSDKAVEAKIKHILATAFADDGGKQWITKELRELVKLAREGEAFDTPDRCE